MILLFEMQTTKQLLGSKKSASEQSNKTGQVASTHSRGGEKLLK
jgi:hypothetical protein